MRKEEGSSDSLSSCISSCSPDPRDASPKKRIDTVPNDLILTLKSSSCKMSRSSSFGECLSPDVKLKSGFYDAVDISLELASHGSISPKKGASPRKLN